MTPDEALKRLLAGNERFVNGTPEHPRQDVERREAVANEQDPFAIVLTCSDSRVAPEVLFDQGLGDLFVIRVAGNVVDPIVLGSIEFAAVRLGTPLIVVLAHSSCGAVTAAVEGGELEGSLPSVAARLQPAVEATMNEPGDAVDNAIRANAWLAVERLLTDDSPLAGLVDAGSLKIAAAYYDLASGQVTPIS